MRLGWVIRYVSDAQASAGFYARAFGLATRFDAGPDFVAMETGATCLAFARAGFVAGQDIPVGSAAAPWSHEVALEVDDLPAAHARALAAGAVEVSPPVEKPWGQHVSYLRDADGALVELCTALPTSEG